MLHVFEVVCPKCSAEFPSDNKQRSEDILISCPDCDHELPASLFKRAFIDAHAECCKECFVCEYSEACDSNGLF